MHASTLLLRRHLRRDFRSVGARVAPIRYLGRATSADDSDGQMKPQVTDGFPARTRSSLLASQNEQSDSLAVPGVEVVGYHELGQPGLAGAQLRPPLREREDRNRGRRVLDAHPSECPRLSIVEWIPCQF